MNTRIRTLLVALLLLALPVGVQAQYTCATNDGVITITGYAGAGGAVVIPAAINGYPVTSIGAGAFYYCYSLTSVIIPNSVTNIEYNAFDGCYYLTGLLLGNGVTSISDSAFSGCPGLTSVIIPNSVTNIGSDVFAGDGLTNITVNAANPVYSSLNGVMFDKTQTTLIQFPMGRSGAYVIPNNVTSIGTEAFGDCYNLTGVTIGNSIANIGAYAFDDCHNLTSVINGNSVVSIGYSAFANCWSLPGVTIGSNVTSIGDSAFYYCSGLTNLTVNGNVTSIGSEPFLDCYNLTSVTIGAGVTNMNFFSQLDYSSNTGVTNIAVNAANPVYSSLNGVMLDKLQTVLLQFPKGRGGIYVIPNSVTSIGAGGFGDCDNLKGVGIDNNVISIGDRAFYECSLPTVTIPNSVITIGAEAFYYCFSLTNVSIGNNVTSIGDSAFSECSLLSVTIPNKVASIGNGAFSGCSHLTNVSIGSNVTSIGDRAFYFCNLTSVTIPGSVTNIGTEAFEANYNLGNANFLTSAYFLGNAPSNDGPAFEATYATVYYLPGTTGWGTTYGGVPAVLWNPQAQNAGVTGGRFGFGITGPASTVIVVEACTNLSHSGWIPVSTNTLSGGGISAFSDPHSGNYPNRYYRFRSP